MKNDYDELSEYLDHIAVEVIRDSDSLHAASTFEKRVWGIGCLLHHAGANGLDALLDYNHSDSPITLLAGIEALDAIGASELHSVAFSYWLEVTDGPRKAGLTIPASIDEGKKEEFYRIYDYWNSDIDILLAAQNRSHRWSEMFISCGDTDLPRLALDWIHNEKNK